MSTLPRKYRVGDPRNGADLTPDMKAYDRSNAKDRKRMIKVAFAEERAEFENRQLSLLDWTEAQEASGPAPTEFTVAEALATMRVILKQYHLSAVAGSTAMQLDAIDQFKTLVKKFNPLYPAMSVLEVQDFLFGDTDAKPGEDVLFGQAFEREVDLGPCRALLEFDGFGLGGLCMCLKAVDAGPFISSTGFRSCSVQFLGWDRKQTHFLEGKSVLEYMTALAVTGLDRVKKTGELKVETWKPFDYRTHTQKVEDDDVAA